MHPPTNMSVLSCLAFAATVATASVASAPPVLAADIAAAPSRAIAPSWTGFYVGVHGGWGWGRTEIQDPNSNPIFNPTVATYGGPLAGGQIGANWQLGNVVLGAEVDGSWAFVRGNTNRNQTIITSSTNNGLGYRALATGAGRDRLRDGSMARLRQGRGRLGRHGDHGAVPGAAHHLSAKPDRRGRRGGAGSRLPAQRLRQGRIQPRSTFRPITSSMPARTRPPASTTWSRW